MKVLKIKKKYYGDLEFMYKDLGLIRKNEFGRDSVDPNNVLMSDIDAKTLKKVITEKFKDKYPYLNKIKLEGAVGMYLLNLQPSTVAGKAIKPGYLIVL